MARLIGTLFWAARSEQMKEQELMFRKVTVLFGVMLLAVGIGAGITIATGVLDEPDSLGDAGPFPVATVRLEGVEYPTLTTEDEAMATQIVNDSTVVAGLLPGGVPAIEYLALWQDEKTNAKLGVAVYLKYREPTTLENKWPTLSNKGDRGGGTPSTEHARFEGVTQVHVLVDLSSKSIVEVLPALYERRIDLDIKTWMPTLDAISTDIAATAAASTSTPTPKAPLPSR